MRRRKYLALAALALLLAGVGSGGMLYRARAPEAAADVPLTPATPATRHAPVEVKPVTEPRPGRAPKQYLVRKAAPRAPLAAASVAREVDAMPVELAGRLRPAVFLKPLESLTVPAAAIAPAAPAVEAGLAPGRRYLVFVNQCDTHEAGSAAYRQCRAAEVRRLAFGCSFYLGELQRVGRERRGEAEGWKDAYCGKASAYRSGHG